MAHLVVALLDGKMELYPVSQLRHRGYEAQCGFWRLSKFFHDRFMLPNSWALKTETAVRISFQHTFWTVQWKYLVLFLLAEPPWVATVAASRLRNCEAEVRRAIRGIISSLWALFSSRAECKPCCMWWKAAYLSIVIHFIYLHKVMAALLFCSSFMLSYEDEYQINFNADLKPYLPAALRRDTLWWISRETFRATRSQWW